MRFPGSSTTAINRNNELIDVSGYRADAISATFEMEHTTAIYSGLLRMSNLVSMQSNMQTTCSRQSQTSVGRRSHMHPTGPPSHARNRPRPGSAASAPTPKLRRGMEQIGR